MSYSLKLINGDLSLQGGSYETVTGADKLRQDLRNYVLEPIGTDSMHLNYGSVIDGGRLPSGEIVPSPIGQSDHRKIAAMVESEIRRIIGEYKLAQLARIKSDNLTYSHSTIRPDEVIQTINDIQTMSYLDGMYVKVRLTTFGGQAVNLNLAVSG